MTAAAPGDNLVCIRAADNEIPFLERKEVPFILEHDNGSARNFKRYAVRVGIVFRY